VTRNIIVAKLNDEGDEMSAEEHAEHLWDLWLINGMFQFGLPLRDLLNTRLKMEKLGLKPPTYDSVFSTTVVPL